MTATATLDRFPFPVLGDEYELVALVSNDPTADGAGPEILLSVTGIASPGTVTEWLVGNVVVDIDDTTNFRTFPPYTAGASQVSVFARRKSGDGGIHITNIAALSGTFDAVVIPPPPQVTETAITIQPSDRAGQIGDQVTFSVTAVGENLTYVTELSQNSGATWFTIDTAASHTVPLFSLDQDGELFRFVVSGDNGVVTSNTALLTVTPADVTTIIVHPSSGTVNEGSTITFDARASEGPYTVERLAVGTSVWVQQPGFPQAGAIGVYSVLATPAGDGDQYRFVFNGVPTNPATLNVVTSVALGDVTITDRTVT